MSDLPYQYAYHSELDLASTFSLSEYEKVCEVCDKKKELRCVSFHLGSCYSHPIERDKMYWPGGERYSLGQLLSHVRENVINLRNMFRNKNIVLAVENNNFYATGAYEIVTDPQFISDIVKENKLKLVFDIAHAHISAHNMKMPYKEYCNALPLDQMIQIHISKHHVKSDGVAVDAHDEPDEELFVESKSLVKTYNPLYLTIEYYQDSKKLIALLEKYAMLCDNPKEMCNG